MAEQLLERDARRKIDELEEELVACYSQLARMHARERSLAGRARSWWQRHTEAIVGWVVWHLVLLVIAIIVWRTA